MIDSDSYILQIETHLSFAIRIVSNQKTMNNEEMLDRIFRKTNSHLVKRDIILVMARWNSWQWLSDLRSTFRNLSVAERRALIVASFKLRDEGRHWRQSVKNEFTPFEDLVRQWASEKSSSVTWQIPL